MGITRKNLVGLQVGDAVRFDGCKAWARVVSVGDADTVAGLRSFAFELAGGGTAPSVLLEGSTTIRVRHQA